MYFEYQSFLKIIHLNIKRLNILNAWNMYSLFIGNSQELFSLYFSMLSVHKSITTTSYNFGYKRSVSLNLFGLFYSSKVKYALKSQVFPLKQFYIFQLRNISWYHWFRFFLFKWLNLRQLNLIDDDLSCHFQAL